MLTPTHYFNLRCCAGVVVVYKNAHSYVYVRTFLYILIYGNAYHIFSVLENMFVYVYGNDNECVNVNVNGYDYVYVYDDECDYVYIICPNRIFKIELHI